MQRIGILGGSFDPIHEGHLELARHAKAMAGLDLVYMLPMADPAHRETHSHARHRLQMCRLALEEEEGILLSEAGMQEKVRYTVETLKIIQKQHPGDALYFIIGADKLPSLPYWQGAQEIFALCEILCFPRKGIFTGEAIQRAEQAGARVHLLGVKEAPFSSTLIRSRTARYEDAPGIKKNVLCYMAENGLYREDLLPRIREMMSAHRFRHTLGVQKAAIHLAAVHHLPVQKAALAALLHDIAKGMDQPELAQLAEHYHLVDTEKTLMIGAVLHGPVGAWLAQKQFGIQDEDVLNAIRYHTVGRVGMTPFEMAVFVADAIEEGREDYPGLQKIRWLAEKSLPCAVLCSIEGTRKYIESHDGRELDASSLATEEYIRSLLTEQEKQWMCASIP